jgi:aspartyl-tRNA synthetase
MTTSPSTSSSLSTAQRTSHVGVLTEANIGQTVVLKGWLYRRRDLGGIIFIDLRDRTGVVQARVNPDDIARDRYEAAHHLRSEYCLALRGEVVRRPAGTENKDLPTGNIEVVIREFEVLSASKPLPFQLDEHDKTNEELRLRHRFLDLRRPEMQRNFLLRHKAYKATRDYLCEQGFLEFETPILTKATPEGARDFLVPSRLEPGSFYALPQSPQLFKQLLMMSGYDRYFQIARCFRDEDLRANRQPEFTQIDIEMSFVTVDDVLDTMEGLVAHIWKETVDFDIPRPIQRITYAEAMLKYGSDKPDLRFGLEIHDVTRIMRQGCNFQVFNGIVKKGGAIRGLCLRGKAEEFPNTQLRPDSKFSQRVARECGIRAYAWFKVTADGKLESSITKFFEESALDAIKAEFDAQPGDVLFLVAGEQAKSVADQLGRFRLLLANDFNLIDKKTWRFVWVVDFPSFEWNVEEKRWDAMHHPFTSPCVEDIDKLGTEHQGMMRAQAYDLACNGEELGGGSIRIHRMEVQQKVFEAIGIQEEEAREKFGFLLEALQYGPPPHGGIAFGFDRLIMLLLGEDNIRSVIAFPKTQTGTCPLTGAPSTVPEKSLRDLALRTVVKPKEDAAPAAPAAPAVEAPQA